MALYAVNRLGFKRFGILAPDDNYGQTLADSFQKTVEAVGGTVTASQTYPPGFTDYKKQLMAMGGQDPESTKENEREKTRRLEELKYNISKEIGKILLKARDVSGASGAEATATPSIALVPFVEALSNTACPSQVKDVMAAAKASLDQGDFTVRNDDLVKQAMTRLPVEFKGNTREVTAEQWGTSRRICRPLLSSPGRWSRPIRPTTGATILPGTSPSISRLIGKTPKKIRP